MESNMTDNTTNNNSMQASPSPILLPILLFYLSICALAVICLLSVAVNALLLCALYKVAVWRSWKRRLFVCVTCANLFSSAAVLGTVVTRVTRVKGQIAENTTFKGSDYMEQISDGSHVLITFLLSTFCTANTLVARFYFRYQFDVTVRFYHVLLMAALCATLAYVSVFFGINPHGESTEKPIQFFAGFALHLVLQTIVIACLVVTYKQCAKLEVEFSLRQASQTLEARYRLRHTLDAVRTVSVLVGVHSVLWISSVLLAFGLYTFVPRMSGLIKTFVASMIDVVIGSFCLACPIIFMCKQPRVRVPVVNMLRCRGQTGEPAAEHPAPQNRPERRSNLRDSNKHRDAVYERWQAVEMHKMKDGSVVRAKNARKRTLEK